MATADEVRILVAEQLAQIPDRARREALKSILIEPRLEKREWDYSPERKELSYWVVAESPDQTMALAYSDEGFGPEFPWGWLPNHATASGTLGMDVQWNWYLEEAFVRSGLWEGPFTSDDDKR